MSYTGHVKKDSLPWQFRIPNATESSDGVMSAADKAKLDGIPPGGMGPPGINAFTITTADFVQPLVGVDVLVDVDDSSWIVDGQVVFVENGGYYTVDSIPNPTQVTLLNRGLSGNALPGTTIPAGGGVAPGGVEGPSGAAGFESSFGGLITTTSGGPSVYVGINGYAPDLTSIAGRVVVTNKEVTTMMASVSVSLFTPPAPVFAIKLYRSTDGGLNYSAVAGATLTIDTGSSLSGQVTFPAEDLLATTLHAIGIQQLSGGSGFVDLPFSVTVA